MSDQVEAPFFGLRYHLRQTRFRFVTGLLPISYPGCYLYQPYYYKEQKLEGSLFHKLAEDFLSRPMI